MGDTAVYRFDRIWHSADHILELLPRGTFIERVTNSESDRVSIRQVKRFELLFIRRTADDNRGIRRTKMAVVTNLDSILQFVAGQLGDFQDIEEGYPAVNIPLVNSGATGVSIATNKAVRSGNVVCVMVEITLTGAKDDWVTIMTGLPASAMNLGHIWTETNWGTSYSRPLRCQITTSGQLQIRYGAATIYRLNTTYVCA